MVTTQKIQSQQSAGADECTAGEARIQGQIGADELVNPCSSGLPLSHQPADDSGTGNDVAPPRPANKKNVNIDPKFGI